MLSLFIVIIGLFNPTINLNSGKKITIKGSGPLKKYYFQLVYLVLYTVFLWKHYK